MADSLRSSWARGLSTDLLLCHKDFRFICDALGSTSATTNSSLLRLNNLESSPGLFGFTPKENEAPPSVTSA